MAKLRRRHVVHVWRCLLERSWNAHCGAGHHLRFQDSYHWLFHLADTLGNTEFRDGTGYEGAWLFLAVLLAADPARDAWLAEFGLRPCDLWRGHLMLTDAERARVAEKLVRLEHRLRWRRPAVAVLLDSMCAQ